MNNCLNIGLHNNVNELYGECVCAGNTVFWVFDCMKLLVYLCTRGVASAGPCGGSLCRAVRALSWQPSTAVGVAEALAVLFADLREQTAECLQTLLT